VAFADRGQLIGTTSSRTPLESSPVPIDCALLCDAATVREGLLHILGGGITRLHRSEYPSPLGTALAVRVMVHPTEADRGHQFEARLLSEDGEEIGNVQVGFEMSSPHGVMRPGEELSVALPLSLHGLGIPHPGAYSFELLIDAVHHASVGFVAERGQPEVA
jgi:hypothetical protein